MIAALVDLLGTFYQAGNLEQMEAIARSMLAAIPDDLVALQFLGLALYQAGRVDDAYRTFKRVAGRAAAPLPPQGACEPAIAASYREATRPEAGLAEAWHRIARLLAGFGMATAAQQAREAALAAGLTPRRRYSMRQASSKARRGPRGYSFAGSP